MILVIGPVLSLFVTNGVQFFIQHSEIKMREYANLCQLYVISKINIMIVES